MRPGYLLILLLFFMLMVDGGLIMSAQRISNLQIYNRNANAVLVSGLGLTDLCVATEARYTRHPAVTDPVSPFMDHPGGLEHFPSGSFWAVPDHVRGPVEKVEE